MGETHVRYADSTPVAAQVRQIKEVFEESIASYREKLDAIASIREMLDSFSLGIEGLQATVIEEGLDLVEEKTQESIGKIDVGLRECNHYFAQLETQQQEEQEHVTEGE